MTTANLELREILADVTPEKPKVLYGVSWEDYIELCESIVDETNLKISCNRGVLKVIAGFQTR